MMVVGTYIVKTECCEDFVMYERLTAKHWYLGATVNYWLPGMYGEWGVPIPKINSYRNTIQSQNKMF
jgi:hypothetical protein